MYCLVFRADVLVSFSDQHGLGLALEVDVGLAAGPRRPCGLRGTRTAHRWSWRSGSFLAAGSAMVFPCSFGVPSPADPASGRPGNPHPPVGDFWRSTSGRRFGQVSELRQRCRRSGLRTSSQPWNEARLWCPVAAIAADTSAVFSEVQDVRSYRPIAEGRLVTDLVRQLTALYYLESPQVEALPGRAPGSRQLMSGSCNSSPFFCVADGEQAQAEPPELPAAGLPGQGEHLGPGQQLAGQCDDLAPELVLREALQRQVPQPGVRSGEDLGLLAVELLGRDDAPVTQVGELGQLIRRTLRARGPLDITGGAPAPGLARPAPTARASCRRGRSGTPGPRSAGESR